MASLEVETAKERLCQSEIAKKVAHLMRAALSLESESSSLSAGGGADSTGATAARELAQLTSQLPMPEDYALQELRTLTR